MTLESRRRNRQAAFESAVKEALLIGEQEAAVLRYGEKLEAVQWGSAEDVAAHCARDFALFLDHIWPQHGLTAKGLIVADHAGMDRWRMLATQIALSFPEPYELGLHESEVSKLERAIAGLVSDQLLEAYGDPATVNYEVLPDNSVDWKRSVFRPSVAYTLPHLAAQSGYIIPMVLRDLLFAIAASWSEIHDQTNPYEMVMGIYESGVLIDFTKWRFTNASREDLGPLPEAPLPRGS